MKKYCMYCGEELPENAEFCGKCGQKIKGETSNNQFKYPSQEQQKSKIAAGVLGILLGVFGVHNFYLGYTGKAVAQLLITVCTCGFLSFVSAIWGLIEGILILTGSINADAKGIPLGD